MARRATPSLPHRNCLTTSCTYSQRSPAIEILKMFQARGRLRKQGRRIRQCSLCLKGQTLKRVDRCSCFQVVDTFSNKVSILGTRRARYLRHPVWQQMLPFPMLRFLQALQEVQATPNKICHRNLLSCCVLGRAGSPLFSAIQPMQHIQDCIDKSQKQLPPLPAPGVGHPFRTNRSTWKYIPLPSPRQGRGRAELVQKARLRFSANLVEQPNAVSRNLLVLLRSPLKPLLSSPVGMQEQGM